MIRHPTNLAGPSLRALGRGLDIGSSGRAVGYLLFFAMAAFPMVLQLLYIKAGLFAMALFFSVLTLSYRRNTGLHHQVVYWAVFMATLSTAFVLLGILEGASRTATLHSMEIYILWPLLYLVVVGAASDWRILTRLPLVAVLSAVFIGAYGLAYAMAQLGVIPDWGFLAWFSFNSQQAIGTYAGYTRLMSVGLNSLPFLFPFVVTLLFFSYRGVNIATPRTWLWLATILDLALIIMSGRRGLFIIVITALPGAAVIAARSVKRRMWLGWVAGAIAAGALLLVGLDQFLSYTYPQFALSGIWTYFMQGFILTPSTQEMSSALRADQFIVLIRGFQQAPLFGHGFGTAASLVRSTAMPWSYELFYVALLFHVGLVGFFAYFLAVLWIYRSGLRIIRTQVHARWMVWSVLMGMTGMLIANATNPYLVRFDGLWAIFWPLAIINYWMNRQCNPTQYLAVGADEMANKHS